VAPQGEAVERLLWWLIAGTRGGATRGMIIQALKQMPRNANQLADELKLDYKTVRHHLGILAKNGMVSQTGNSYAVTYFLSAELEERYNVFETIWGRIGKNKKSRVH